MSKAKCCVALGTPTNERIGRAARDPFSRSSPRPKWCGRSFRPRFSSLGENAFGSADSPCGRPPRVPRRFAIALVAAPWANHRAAPIGAPGRLRRQGKKNIPGRLQRDRRVDQRKKNCATMRQSQYQFFNGPALAGVNAANGTRFALLLMDVSYYGTRPEAAGSRGQGLQLVVRGLSQWPRRP